MPYFPHDCDEVVYLVAFTMLFRVLGFCISGEDSSAAILILVLAFLLDIRIDRRLGVASASTVRFDAVFCSAKPTLRFGVSIREENDLHIETSQEKWFQQK